MALSFQRYASDRILTSNATFWNHTGFHDLVAATAQIEMYVVAGQVLIVNTPSPEGDGVFTSQPAGVQPVSAISEQALGAIANQAKSDECWNLPTGKPLVAGTGATGLCR